MPRTEVVSKRTPRSKTFDNGDGTFTLESGGSHAHHQQGDNLVDTDCNWSELSTKFGTGQYPFTIDLNKATRTVTIDFLNGDVVTMQPRDSRNPSSITKVGNQITLVRLWTGVNLVLTLLPEGLNVAYVKTATTFVPPAWNVTGPMDKYLTPAYWTSGPLTVPVSHSLVGGVLTYDLSAVPVGAVVR